MKDYQKILDDQKSLLVKILIVTRAQPVIMESDDLDVAELMDCVEERQNLIDKLNALALTESEKQEARISFPGLIAEIDTLLEAIRLQDAETENVANEKLEYIKKQLQNIQKEKKSTHYEGIPVDPGATYFNKKS